MNYHAAGNVISSDYFQLVNEVAGACFPSGSSDPVTLSVPDPRWLERNQNILNNPFGKGAFIRNSWPIVASQNLLKQWTFWKDCSRDTNKFYKANRENYEAAKRWCEEQGVDISTAIEPGPPWHLPLLAVFALAAEKAAVDGGRGYYDSLNQLLACDISSQTLKSCGNPSWMKLWIDVASWSRDAGRGFMAAETPDWFTYVGWPQQHVLLSTAERQELARNLRASGVKDVSIDLLKRVLLRILNPTPQLQRTMGDERSLKLLLSWAEAFVRSENGRAVDVDEQGLGGKERPPTSLQRPRARLVISLDNSETSVETIYLSVELGTDLVASGALEFGGEFSFLRKRGDRRPYDLCRSTDLLSERGELATLEVRWAPSTQRLFVNDGGSWIEADFENDDLPDEREVLVLCRAGEASRGVTVPTGPLRGLEKCYDLVRVNCKDLKPEVFPRPRENAGGGRTSRLQLDGGIPRAAGSRTAFFGVALPRIRNERATLDAVGPSCVAISPLGELALDAAFDGDLPESVPFKITSADGVAQTLFACFPKPTTASTAETASFKDLPKRAEPSALPSEVFELTLKRRFLCIYASDATSSAVACRRMKQLDPSIEKPFGLIETLVDLGHIEFDRSNSDKIERIVPSPARVEVLGAIAGTDPSRCIARLVGAHDWIRLRGQPFKGIAWLYTGDEIYAIGAEAGLRELALALGVALVCCWGTLNDEPMKFNEKEGMLWLDENVGVKVSNPLRPQDKLTLCLKNLKSLLGQTGTCTLEQETWPNVFIHYRIRWDGANWYWAEIEPHEISSARWAAAVQAWRRHGQVTANVEHVVPLPYSAATRTLYFIPRLRPPAVVRRLLCSVAGSLPSSDQTRLVATDTLEVTGNTIDVFRTMYGNRQRLQLYSNVSRARADEVAHFLGGVVIEVRES